MARERERERERLLAARDVARRLELSPATVRRYAKSDPSFPPAVRFGPQLIRWRADAIEAWVATKEAQR